MNNTSTASGLFSDSAGAALARLAIYTLYFLALAESLPSLIEGRGASIIRENGPIEWIQFSALAIVAAVFLAGGFLIAGFRHLLFLIAPIVLFAAIRELDRVLVISFPATGRFFAFVPLLFAMWWGVAKRAALKGQIAEFARTRSCALLWAGFIVIVPVAQMAGGDLFKVVLGDDYIRDHKRAAEEILEMIGGLILLAGCVECIIQLRSRDRASSDLSFQEQKKEHGAG